MNHQPTYYLVVDLEATCDDRGAVPRGEMETIEIGAVLVDAETLQPLDEYQTFIRQFIDTGIT
jgi:3'-5' exoribonuclease 1